MKMRVHMSKGFAFCGGWGTVKGTPSWLKLGHLSRTCQVGWRWGAFRLRHYPGAALRTALGVALGVAYGLHWDCIGTALGTALGSTLGTALGSQCAAPDSIGIALGAQCPPSEFTSPQARDLHGH